MQKKPKFRKIKLRVGSTVLALVLTMDGVIALGLSKKLVIDRLNPFSESTISSNDFLNQYKILKSGETLNTVSSLEEIKNMNDELKKAYLLYYAILYNPSLTDEEKWLVDDAVKYFYDNEYIDAEYVYNQLINVRVKERNATFPGTTISSCIEYRVAPDGSAIGGEIKLGDEFDIFHEYIVHGISRNHYISWIEEGYAGILESEYYIHTKSSYPVESSVIKFLCEIIGKESARELFFKLHALSFESNDNRSDLLTSYLLDVGISPKLSEELYLQMDNFSKFKGKILTDEEEKEKQEILKTIVTVLSKMYNNSNNKNALNKYVCGVYLSNILHEGYNSNYDDVNNKLYYFNINDGQELSSLEKVGKIYPLLDFKEALNISDEEFSSNLNDYQKRGKSINNKTYIELTEEEALLCDDSKMKYYLITYNIEHGKCEYILNEETQTWELFDVYNSPYYYYLDSDYMSFISEEKDIIKRK